MVRLGVYRPGSDTAVDEATQLMPRIEAALSQAKNERSSLTDSFNQLKTVLDQSYGSKKIV